MNLFITVVHVFASVVLVVVILLQVGKGAEVGSAFGGSSQTIFGASGPGTFLEKLTGTMAAIFVVTSLALAYLHSGRHIGSVVEERPAPVEKAPTPQPPPPPQAPAPAPGGSK